MKEVKIPIPGVDQADDIIILVRRHWGAFLPTLFAVFIGFFLPWLFLLFLSFSGSVTESNINIFIVLFFGVYYLIWAATFLVLWISFYCDLVLVTDRSIFSIKQEGIFDRQVSEISLLRIQEGNSDIKGFLGTIFNYGDVIIQTASEKEKAVFENIPNPYQFTQKILNLHEALIHKEGKEKAAGLGEGELAQKYEKVFEQEEKPVSDNKTIEL